MNIKSITKDNIKNINYNDVILVFFAESGATDGILPNPFMMNEGNKIKDL